MTLFKMIPSKIGVNFKNFTNCEDKRLIKKITFRR